MNFKKLSEKAYQKFDITTERAQLLTEKTNKPNSHTNALFGLSKNVLVNRFSFALKKHLKLHALDEHQFKYINDVAYDKMNENAIKRGLLKKKLMKEVSDTFFDKKGEGFFRKIVNLCFFILINLKRKLKLLSRQKTSPSDSA